MIHLYTIFRDRVVCRTPRNSTLSPPRLKVTRAHQVPSVRGPARIKGPFQAPVTEVRDTPGLIVCTHASAWHDKTNCTTYTPLTWVTRARHLPRRADQLMFVGPFLAPVTGVRNSPGLIVTLTLLQQRCAPITQTVPHECSSRLRNIDTPASTHTGLQERVTAPGQRES